MTSEISIPDPQRFTNNDNQVIALEAIFIVILMAYVLFLQRAWFSERKETNKTLLEVAEAVNILTGVINAKK